MIRGKRKREAPTILLNLNREDLKGRGVIFPFFQRGEEGTAFL